MSPGKAAGRIKEPVPGRIADAAPHRARSEHVVAIARSTPQHRDGVTDSVAQRNCLKDEALASASTPITTRFASMRL